MMYVPIHRSSALRASTDAYGAGILADAGVLSEPVYWGWASDSSDKTARPAEHPGRGASFIARVSRHEVPKIPCLP